MTAPESVSDELLNALADRELPEDEGTRLLALMANDPALETRYKEICELKKMVRTAYHDIPAGSRQAPQAVKPFYQNYLSTAAILLLGISIGWLFTPAPTTTAGNFKNIDSVTPETIENQNILLHINSMDRHQVTQVLETAASLLQAARQKHRDFRIEVVANASGLGVLRSGSPYARQIRQLADNNDNIKFMACGIAKKTAMLTEGREIKLIPQAQEIPAALDQILFRLKDGWTYIKGAPN